MKIGQSKKDFYVLSISA